MNQIASHFRRLGEADPENRRQPLGQLLLESGDVTVGELLSSLGEHKDLNVPLGRVLMASGYVSESALFSALAEQWSIPRIRLDQSLDPEIPREIGLDFCLKHNAVPVRIKDGVLQLAVSGMEAFSTAERDLENLYGLVRPVIAAPSEIHAAISKLFPDALAKDSALSMPASDSCRDLAEQTKSRSLLALFGLAAMGVVFTLYPAEALTILTCLAIGLSLSSASIKTAALISHLFPNQPTPTASSKMPERPMVSIMVPLNREPDIAKALIQRLSCLTYPKPLLEILLVIEENDFVTRDALEAAELPPWMKPVFVPEGKPKTKPRALNHAYKFCAGDIIGIYDAEDKPDPDQIDKVVERFKTAPSDVACLQGILQFYNPTQNWLARCFAMDYAAWFRVILPGLSRMGLPVPLGGTTLFLRRDVVDQMHGWDAFNVTEDADLGLRLNRAGYRTELIDTVTGEEANCHGWRWIRQRSRWIKGYMVTYWAHMRRPWTLLCDLGPLSFLAFQVLFLGTILHFITAPLLWSFWLVYLGVDHAFFALVPPVLTELTAVAFLSIEFLGMIILAVACIKAKRSFLIPWIPTMSLYFLLAVPAGLKALWEFFRAPVFWDKTDHGHSLAKDLE